MKEFKIKAFYTNGYSITNIQGKDLPDAFRRFFKKEEKAFRYVTGFEKIDN